MNLEKLLISQFAPKFAPALGKGEAALFDYMNSIELTADETHAGCLLGFNSSREAVFIVVTFNNQTVKRKLASYKKEQLIELVQKMI
jgi:hypothetical protein